ncbi:YbaK/EbsC family protein [Comamonas sp. Y6]|uniref:YbaK/EbsC family protein n=1 Tax=Comamonas resistens TaxID=3046670 RepID=A0ABY8ST88_9BURK|nr:YbaK/EbsC family protein [Comamonas resistens]MDL5035735.1 YbaK/EbsC family protein [Comamonas resistens]WHS65149.1 YbaK/EbsC family protein [Comamonas resistens]HBP0979063.1 prolyl-tRNA synthetase associated domain-containing protein [Pseudomonas aeruginosa]
MSAQTSNEAAAEDAAYRRLSERFEALGIGAKVVPYPEHTTVEEGKALRGAMAGTFTKNLLLKDKKDRHFLLAIHEDRVLDLKAVSALLGGKGHLSFVTGERMQALLGVQPGALTPLGLLQDEERLVTVVVDASLMGDAQLNFHPLQQTESVGLTPKELVAFVHSCGREPLLVDFDVPLPAA